MAECMPKRLASYEAAHTTERLPRYATMTGLPRSCGSSYYSCFPDWCEPNVEPTNASGL